MRQAGQSLRSVLVTAAAGGALAILGLGRTACEGERDQVYYEQPAEFFYVSPKGDDGYSGKLESPSRDEKDGPFRTLERARDEIRRRKASKKLPRDKRVVVEVLAGTYPRERPLELGPEDSGTEAFPIVYRARGGDRVRITGGRVVRGWKRPEDPAILERLDPAARDKILVADLRENGISDFGGVTENRLEVFFRTVPMTLARWPDEGFAKIADVAVKDGHSIHGIQGSKVGKFLYEGDRPARWIGEKDPWVHGYWFWDWSDGRQRIASIDPGAKTISLADPPHHYGYRKGQWYYAFNLLSELDRPGEWYLDRETGSLYFYPPFPIESGDVVVSIAPSLLQIRSARCLEIEGFFFEACRGTAVAIEGCERVQLRGCTLHNIGGSAVTVSGGREVRISLCEICDTGDGGLSLAGGDRKTLEPAGHIAERNHIHHYGRWNRMYTPGIALSGVGNRASGNLIHDAPHQAIAFSGNNHAIEKNEIHDVCTEANDAGAIYSGRDWTWRGTRIEQNYFHDIRGFQGRGCVGVYLDDMLSGTRISRNVFRRVTRAAFIGGGRDNSIENNVFIDCDPAIHIDARALGWAGYHAQEWILEGREKGTLSGIAYSKPPYANYPGLARILDEEPAAPRGNVVAGNICIGGRWEEVEEAARPYVTWKDNIVREDPGFKDLEGEDFVRKLDSLASEFGFPPIPLLEVGLRSLSVRVGAGSLGPHPEGWIGKTQGPRPEWIPLWPDGAPGETEPLGDERDTSGPDSPLVAGRPVIRLGNVSKPAIRIWEPPPERRTGAAVLVCPGGGYHILAMDLEGTEVCEWLASLGVTGALLKYRVPARKGRERYEAPLEDAQRALGILRHRAGEFGIDPGKIGILGFSAGAHLAAVASARFERRTYEPRDEADGESCRPDFAILVYPAYLAHEKDRATLAPELEVSAKTPPTFIVGTADDPVGVESPLVYYLALAKAKVPAEMHLYGEGGHGYGLRPSDKAVISWPQRAEEWLRRLGALERKVR